MREELTNLSALYSAKCVENAMLDEKVAALLENNKWDCHFSIFEDMIFSVAMKSFERNSDRKRLNFRN